MPRAACTVHTHVCLKLPQSHFPQTQPMWAAAIQSCGWPVCSQHTHTHTPCVAHTQEQKHSFSVDQHMHTTCDNLSLTRINTLTGTHSDGTILSVNTVVTQCDCQQYSPVSLKPHTASLQNHSGSAQPHTLQTQPHHCGNRP